MSAAQSVLAGWMRVQINVRNGENASGNAMAAAKLTPWHTMTPAYVRDDVQVFAVDFIPEGWAYVDPGKGRIVFARDSYFTLLHDPDELKAMLPKMLEGGPGLRRVAVTAAAVKAQNNAEGTAAEDRLDVLESDYKALIARLREARDADDNRALGEALRQVRELAERHDALQQELQKIGGYGDVVKTMVRRLA